MLYNKLGVTKISRFSQCNGKLPLPLRKKGNYLVITIYGVWNSREEKLMNYLIFVGKYNMDDAESMYTLLVQNTGTLVHGSNIIAKNKNFKIKGVATCT